MMSTDDNQIDLELLSTALETNQHREIRFMINRGMRPVEVAHLLEKSPPRERRILWGLINQDNEGDVLQHLGDDIQAEILS